MTDAGYDGHQHHEILQDDENTEEEEDDHRDTDVVLGIGDGPVLQAACVVVMPQNYMADPSGFGCGIQYGGVVGVTGWH